MTTQVEEFLLAFGDVVCNSKAGAETIRHIAMPRTENAEDDVGKPSFIS